MAYRIAIGALLAGFVYLGIHVVVWATHISNTLSTALCG